MAASLFAPLLLTVAALYGYFNSNALKTEKELVSYYELNRAENTGPLSYMGKAPFSARFYSRGQVDEVELAAQPLNKQEGSNTQEFVAISNKERHRYALPKEAVAVFSNRRYTLYRLEGAYLAPIVATKSERYFKAEPRSSNVQH